MSKVILGIHSNVRSDTIDPETGEPISFDDGHGWISVTRDGVTTNYGLWPDFSRAGDNGEGYDIRIGMENGDRAAASRYFELDEAQVALLEQRLKENVTWGYTSNCSSWASETVEAVTGVSLNADEAWSLGVVETPRQLGDAIREMEQKDRTSPLQPVTADSPEPSSLESTANSLRGAEEQALSPVSRQLMEDANQQVHALAEKYNLPWDQGLANTAAAIAMEARSNGLTRITHLSVADGQIRYAQHDGATLKDGEIDAVSAANTPADQSIRGMEKYDQAIEAKERQQPQAVQQQVEAPVVEAPAMAGP